MNDEIVKWYRYVDDIREDVTTVLLMELIVTRETPKGVWLHYGVYSGNLHGKFCLKDSNRRFAYPTHEEALNSYIIRKKKRIAYCERDLNIAKDCLALANNMKSNGAIRPDNHRSFSFNFT